jgi:hypothetical protein
MVDNPSTLRLTKIRLPLDAGGMKQKPSTFIEIIDLWETPPFNGVKSLAKRLNFPEARVYKWRERNVIGLAYWDAVIEAARADHRVKLTHADLYAMRMAQRQVAQEAA